VFCGNGFSTKASHGKILALIYLRDLPHKAVALRGKKPSFQRENPRLRANFFA
jgi:hypothetical protein